MSNFKVLKYNKEMMTFLGIYPSPRAIPTRLSQLHTFNFYFTIFGMIAVVTLSATYVHHEFNITRFQYVFEALALTFGGTVGLCAFLNMKWKMDKVADLQLKFQEIVDQGTTLILNVSPLSNFSPFFQSPYKNQWRLCIGALSKLVVDSPNTWAHMCYLYKLQA